MQVYIEYAIIDNLIIDYLILKLSLTFARLQTKVLRILISSAIGTAVAIVIPLIQLSKFLQIAIKILLAVLMVFICGKYYKAKNYFLTLLYFFIITFLFGGIIIGLFYLADIDYKIYFNLNYDSFMPIGISILIVYISYLIINKLVKNLFKIRDVSPFLRKCLVQIKNKKISAFGFVDSGNRLFDYKTGAPIIVASRVFIDKLKKAGVLPQKYSVMKIDTVSGQGFIKIFKIDKLLIYNGLKANIFNNVLIGEGQSDFLGDGEYDILLNPSLI